MALEVRSSSGRVRLDLEGGIAGADGSLAFSSEGVPKVLVQCRIAKREQAEHFVTHLVRERGKSTYTHTRE